VSENGSSTDPLRVQAGDGAATSGRRARPASRVHGVLPLNKTSGITSFQAVREVRRILGERRVGHAGTLDPQASGLLPICVGQATRLVDYLHLQLKQYHCVVRLGERSDTHDLEGEVVRSGDASGIDALRVTAVLERFVGEIQQVPPMHSAVRSQGRHLYELARQGIEVERQPRTVLVKSADLVSFRPGEVAEAELQVVCGKGAYMRVLAADLGDALGTGGLLGWLERTAYGPLVLAEAITIEELAALPDPGAALRPPEVAVSALTRIDLAPQLATQVRRGQPVWLPRVTRGNAEGTTRAHGPGGELVAVGEVQGNLFRPTKVMSA
jgi:tRNA pseudouridine55 synthase